jgi:hypothetical protein
MSEPHQRKASAEIGLLHALSERCTGQSPPSLALVEEALERGSAELISLEAAVRSTQASTDDEHREDEELLSEVEMLRAALADLRQAVSSRTGPVVPGFVFRSRRQD